MEVRNVIKVPPVRPRVRFLSYQGLRPSPLLSSTLDSLIIPHFHPPHRETLLFALEIFCGTGMGQGNQTATTLSSPLPPPPPPPPLFFLLSFFFFYRLSSSIQILSTSRSLSVAKFLITDPIVKIIGGGG